MISEKINKLINDLYGIALEISQTNDFDDVRANQVVRLHLAAFALRKRIAELEAAREWRPIDTAPKDGTEYLVYCKYTIMVMKACDWKPGVALCSACEEYGASDATHWQPLPEPPAI